MLVTCVCLTSIASVSSRSGVLPNAGSLRWRPVPNGSIVRREMLAGESGHRAALDGNSLVARSGRRSSGQRRAPRWREGVGCCHTARAPESARRGHDRDNARPGGFRVRMEVDKLSGHGVAGVERRSRDCGYECVIVGVST